MTSSLLVWTLLSFSPATEPLDDFIEPPMLEIGGPPPCDTDRDCFTSHPYCNPDAQCVECLLDEHCDEGWVCLDTDRCADACVVDEDCDGVEGSICNPEGLCVECLADEDCQPDEYCFSQEYCYSDYCTPGEQLCWGGDLQVCLDNGGSTEVVESCVGGCEESEAGPACVDPPNPGGTAGPGATSGPTDDTTAGEPPPPDETGTPGSGNPTTAGDGGSDGNAEDENQAQRQGCSCHTQSTPDGGAAALWLLLVAGLRRRIASRPR